MYIHTVHVEMDTSKPRNKQIMSIKKKKKISLIYKSAWSRVNIYTRVHAHKTKNMFVIENYMYTEHRHTKCMGCLKQHNTGWSSTWTDIYIYIYIIYNLCSWFHVTSKRDNI